MECFRTGVTIKSAYGFAFRGAVVRACQRSMLQVYWFFISSVCNACAVCRIRCALCECMTNVRARLKGIKNWETKHTHTFTAEKNRLASIRRIPIHGDGARQRREHTEDESLRSNKRTATQFIHFSPMNTILLSLLCSVFIRRRRM